MQMSKIKSKIGSKLIFFFLYFFYIAGVQTPVCSYSLCTCSQSGYDPRDNKCLRGKKFYYCIILHFKESLIRCWTWGIL